MRAQTANQQTIEEEKKTKKKHLADVLCWARTRERFTYNHNVRRTRTKCYGIVCGEANRFENFVVRMYRYIANSMLDFRFKFLIFFLSAFRYCCYSPPSIRFAHSAVIGVTIAEFSEEKLSEQKEEIRANRIQ